MNVSNPVLNVNEKRIVVLYDTCTSHIYVEQELLQDLSQTVLSELVSPTIQSERVSPTGHDIFVTRCIG
jgi:hypothetical protein